MDSLPTELIVLILRFLLGHFDQTTHPSDVAALVTRLDAVRLVCRRFNTIILDHFPQFVREGRQAILQRVRFTNFSFKGSVPSDYVRLVLLNVGVNHQREYTFTRHMTPIQYRNKMVATDLLIFAERKDLSYLVAFVDCLVAGGTGITLPERLSRNTGYGWLVCPTGVSQAAMDQLLRLYPADALSHLTSS